MAAREEVGMAESMRSSTRPVEGVTLGKYRLLAQLGRGGMAEVYLAIARGAKGVNKLVVLKVLRSHLAEDPDFVSMFVDEARIAARLNHSNIVQTYEVAEESSRHFIVMEYLEGRSLSQVESMLKPERLPLDLALRIFADALAGLHHAHELRDLEGHTDGLVHRDVSPQNVFVTYDGQVKIVDFGIAKASNSNNHTKEGVIKGKIRYMAPEQVLGVYLDRRADIFAVGVMLWHALTGKRLWDGVTDEIAIMHRLVTNSPPLPTPGSVADVPPELDAICSKAMAHSRDDRFATAAEFQDAIEEYLAKHPPVATTRAVGQFMSARFGERQAEFQRLIDEQVRLASAEADSGSMSFSSVRSASRLVPRFDDGPLDSGPFPLSGEFSTTPSSGRLRAPSTASHRTSPGTSNGVSARIDPSSVPPGETSSRAPVTMAPPRMRRRRTAAIAAGVGAIAVIGAFALLARLSSDREDLTSSRAEAAAASPGGGANANGSSGPASANGDDTNGPNAPQAAPPSSPADPPPKAPRAAAASNGAPAPRPSPFVARAAAPIAHRPTSAPPPSVEPRPAKKEVDCASPYFVDEQGIKRIRAECL